MFLMKHISFTSYFCLYQLCVEWKMVVANCLMVDIGAATMETEALPHPHPSQRRTRAPLSSMKAWTWNWTKCCSTSQRQGNARYSVKPNKIIYQGLVYGECSLSFLRCFFCPLELSKSCVSVLVAKLWKNTDHSSGHQTSHSQFSSWVSIKSLTYHNHMFLPVNVAIWDIFIIIILCIMLSADKVMSTPKGKKTSTTLKSIRTWNRPIPLVATGLPALLHPVPAGSHPHLRPPRTCSSPARSASPPRAASGLSILSTLTR